MARITLPIEEIHRATTTTCHLANISLKVGRKVYWDAKAERCRLWNPKSGEFGAEDAEANAYLFREPRKPWTIPLG